MARRLILLATPRSGSRLVNTLLREHPDVELYDEIFTRFEPPLGPTPRPGDDFATIRAMGRSYYDWFFARPSAKRYLGFTLHLLNDRSHTRWALADREAVKICVRRRNLLAQYVSLRRGVRTNTWVLRPGECFVPPPPIRVPPGAFERFVDLQLCGWGKVERRCDRTGVERHTVWYEEVAENRLRPLLAALGLPDAPLSPGYVKQGEGTVRDRVANWSELARRLSPACRAYLEMPDAPEVR